MFILVDIKNILSFKYFFSLLILLYTVKKVSFLVFFIDLYFVTFCDEINFENFKNLLLRCIKNTAVLKTNFCIAAVECPIPSNPTFGRVMFNSVTYNSMISYECNYGYMIVGTSLKI
jgi:hypothetical protein